MPSKTTINWLFNDIWCYLFIAYFDRKIGVFQQAVVRVYYILKYRKALSAIPFFHGEYVNLTISQQQLQLFVKHSKFLEEQLLTFALGSTYSLNFLSGYCSFWERYC